MGTIPCWMEKAPTWMATVRIPGCDAPIAGAALPSQVAPSLIAMPASPPEIAVLPFRIALNFKGNGYQAHCTRKFPGRLRELPG
jgi:hypothetical protein